MALKSILDVQVNDESFQKFTGEFRKYNEDLNSTPASWKNVVDEIKRAANTISEMNAKYNVVTNNIAHTIGKVTNNINTQAHAWNRMAKDAGRFAVHIAEATRSLLRWGALTGLVSGILGVGGLFGIERLALSAGTQRAQGLALGLKPGEAKAFETNLGSRGYDTNAFLENVNKGLLDLTSEQYLGLRTLGVDTNGKDTNTVALDALTKLKQQVDKIPLGPLFEPSVHARRLDQIMSIQDIERLRRTPANEVGDYAERIRKDQETLTLTGQTAKAWQDLNAQLTRAGNTLQNMLIDKLTDLAPQISHLSEAFTKTVGAILSRPELKEWIDALAEAIKRFGDWVGSKSFQDGVVSFVEGVSKVAQGIWTLVSDILEASKSIRNWFSGNPDNTVKDEKPNPYPQGTPEHDQYYYDHPRQLRFPWNSGGLYKWWHGQEETPPPSDIQKQSFDRLEGEQGLPSGLLNAVFQAESGGGKNLYSPAGAVGPFQFTKGAWDQYGGGGSPLDFQDSASASARYFHKLLDEFHGDVAKAAAGYNAGEGNVERAIAQYGENWRRGLPKPEETLPYIDRIVRALGNKVPTGKSANTTVAINVYNQTGGNAYVSASQLAV